MPVDQMYRPRQLQAEADRYRRLAGGAAPWPAVRRLAELAEECDREAVSLIESGWMRGTATLLLQQVDRT